MIYRVKRTDTYRSIGAQFGQTDEILIAAELAAANPYRACLLDGLPTLLGGLRPGEALNLPKMWDLDTPRAWGTMREGASECSHNGDWGAAVMDRGIRIPERGLSLEMRQPPASPAMSLEKRGISGVPQTLAGPPACGGGQVAEYHPEGWDFDNGTYTVQSGDDPIGIVNLYQLCFDPSHPIHELNALNGNQVTNNDGTTNAAYWNAPAVLKMPMDKITWPACPDGWQKRANGVGCERVPAGGKKTPALAIADTGSMWLLVGGVLAALGIGVAVAKAKKKRAA